jgi:leader peptidase (prepilin peptidase)/N-methyltransferase
MPPQLLIHLPTAVFVFALGASVGSFINVVVYRLPLGMSVISPPSRCPTCGARLRFYRENLPIIGWLLLRGRCRYCRVRISPQYMYVELLLALVFLGLYVLLFMVSPRTMWWGQIGDTWWYTNGPFRAWPAFIAMAFLIAGLIAMTLIDAKQYVIPIEIPLVVTLTAFVAYPLQSLLVLDTRPGAAWPIPGVGWTGTAVSIGGMVGVLVGVLLLRLRVLKPSFADYEQFVVEGDVLADYPYARREMVRELIFLLPCMLGMLLGLLVSQNLPATGPPPLIQSFAAACAGYLVGGGLIWGIRIVGTLAFGREAMGLGDVHLLAAVGATLGWFDPIPIFFIAPFFGLFWVLIGVWLGSLVRSVRRELPYGPHLAAAAVCVILLRPGVEWIWGHTLGQAFPWPTAGLVP